MLTLDLRAEDIKRAIVSLGATEEQARKALNSTLGKMASWVRTRSLRAISSETKIQQKVLRSRLKTFRMQAALSHITSDGSAKVWFGLNPVPWARLSPKGSRKGGVTAAGGRHDPHAFIATLHGRPQVLRRVGKGRVPLEVVTADIESDANKFIEKFVLASAEFEKQFFLTFERELRWRTSKRS